MVDAELYLLLLLAGSVLSCLVLLNLVRHFECQLMSGLGCKQVKPEEIELVRRDYAANGGWETFLAYEDPRQDILVGLLRLRKVSGAAKSRQAELQGRCSIVRELHVYGTAVAVSARDATKQQHQVGAPAAIPLCCPACIHCE